MSAGSAGTVRSERSPSILVLVNEDHQRMCSSSWISRAALTEDHLNIKPSSIL